MERRRQFTPTISDRLEGRVVLSQTTLGLSPVVKGLAPHLQALNRRQTALVAEVNQAFDSFQSDFDQARATYFASVQADPTAAGSSTMQGTPMNAFSTYTKQRTLLLSQQLISSFIQSPQGTARAPHSPPALKVLIETKVTRPNGKGPAGSLISSLDENISQMGTPTMVTSPMTTLYTLSQDNAIEAARTAVLNGVSLIKSGAFGIQKQSHY